MKGLVTAKTVREFVLAHHHENKLYLNNVEFDSETTMLDLVDRINNSSINTLVICGWISKPEFFRYLTKIKILNFSEFGLDQDMVTDLSHLMPLLEVIIIRPSYVDETVNIVSLFEQGTKLTRILLSSNLVLVTEKLITSIIIHCKDLTILELSSFFTKKAAEILAEWIPNSNLISLHLFMLPIYNKIIVDALPLSKIKSIQFRGHNNPEYMSQIIPRTRIVEAYIDSRRIGGVPYAQGEYQERTHQTKLFDLKVKQNKIRVPVRRNLNALIVANTVSPDIASLLLRVLVE